MRGLFVLVLLVVAVPGAARAQQSLFNVPAGTGTRAGGVFVQEQLNLGSTAESNLTVDFGLVPGLEVGFNIFHVDLLREPPGRAARSLVMVNAVYTVAPADWLAFQASAMVGVGRHKKSPWDPAALLWMTARLELLDDWVCVTTGVYAGTPAWLGEPYPVGPMAGVELKLFPNVFHLQADAILGFNEAAVMVLGGVVFLPAGLQVSFGVQTPAPLTENPFGLVLEITRTP